MANLKKELSEGMVADPREVRYSPRQSFSNLTSANLLADSDSRSCIPHWCFPSACLRAKVGAYRFCNTVGVPGGIGAGVQRRIRAKVVLVRWVKCCPGIHRATRWPLSPKNKSVCTAARRVFPHHLVAGFLSPEYKPQKT